MTPEAKAGEFEDLANGILELDARVFTCTIISNPQGAVLVRTTKREFQQSLGKLPDSMAAHWALLAFNAMERLDSTRSKAKYMAIGREELTTLIFPADKSRNYMVIMTVRKDTELAMIFETATRFIERKFSH